MTDISDVTETSSMIDAVYTERNVIHSPLYYGIAIPTTTTENQN